jgi:hypothetical protein
MFGVRKVITINAEYLGISGSEDTICLIIKLCGEGRKSNREKGKKKAEIGKKFYKTQKTKRLK